jgi:hypothetical protein
MRRRTLIVGGGTAGAIAAVAGLWRFTGLFRSHAPTPYDDLLGALDDRDQAVMLGKRVRDMPDAETLAGELRARLGDGGLGKAAMGDVAAGRMTEVDGWVLPRSVAQLSALAARV